MNNSSQTIGILGAGAWGSALAKHATRCKHTIHVWHKEASVLNPVNDPLIHYSRDVNHLSPCDIILCVVPAQAVRTVITEFSSTLNGKTLIICSKGIENKTHMLMSEVIEDVRSKNTSLDIEAAVLSGPNFAKEIFEEKPAIFSLAASSIKRAQALINILQTSSFKGQPSTDLTGVQLGGALKNIIAVGCGMTIGAGLGDNAKAALLTLGLNEIKKLGLTMQANEETFYGPSGIGDLVLTCNGPLSRNLNFGINLGKGMTATEAIQHQSQTTEGYYTAQSAVSLAEKHSVNVPVLHNIHQLLQEKQTLERTIKNLFSNL